MNRSPDHYRTLGVIPQSTIEQIKAAYHRRAHKFHPDKNHGSTEMAECFRRCAEAYATLSDPTRRAAYDREFYSHFPGLLGEVLGGLTVRRRKRRQRGHDLDCHLHLSFLEAARGTEKQIVVEVDELCVACQGHGAAEEGTAPCLECGGRREQILDGGALPLPEPCPACGGTGLRITKPCVECGGPGTKEARREYLVRLPPGTEDQRQQILSGEGAPGYGGAPPGDLRVIVHVAADPLLSRRGTEILLEIPIGFTLAALGGTIDVPTLDGEVMMKIPPATQSGTVFRLPAKGIAAEDGRRSDQLVTIVVETPAALEPGQAKLLLQFGEGAAASVYPRQAEYRRRREESGQ